MTRSGRRLNGKVQGRRISKTTKRKERDIFWQGTTPEELRLEIVHGWSEAEREAGKSTKIRREEVRHLCPEQGKVGIDDGWGSRSPSMEIGGNQRK